MFKHSVQWKHWTLFGVAVKVFPYFPHALMSPSGYKLVLVKCHSQGYFRVLFSSGSSWRDEDSVVGTRYFPQDQASLWHQCLLKDYRFIPLLLLELNILIMMYLKHDAVPVAALLWDSNSFPWAYCKFKNMFLSWCALSSVNMAVLFSILISKAEYCKPFHSIPLQIPALLYKGRVSLGNWLLSLNLLNGKQSITNRGNNLSRDSFHPRNSSS